MNLDTLRPDWTEWDDASIGRRIFEAVPHDQRPDWAGSLLLYVAGTAFLCDDLSRIVELSIDSDKWSEAKQAFEAVRQLTLENERRGLQESHRQLVLDVGETAAKVIYNASGYPGPFDLNAGWHMAPRIKRLAQLVAQDEFENCCSHLLIRRPPS